MAMDSTPRNEGQSENHEAAMPSGKYHSSKSKTRSKHKSQATVHSVNYEQQSHSKKTSKKAKKKKTSATATKNALARPPSDIDVNAVPNPAPDSGVSHSLYPSGVVYSGVLPVVVPTSTHPPVSSSGFSPLPPLSAFATSLAATVATTAGSSTHSATPSAGILSSEQQQAHSSGPKHLSTVIIVLLAVGSAFFLLGCYVLYRIFRRPRKHHYPTPSLPILQDDFMEDRKVDPEEESLFGGKERLSANPGSDAVPLTWTQYPHVSLAKPPASLTVDPGNSAKRKSSDLPQKSAYPFSGPNANATNAPARSANRLSIASASIYPGSPMSGNVGVAVTGSPLTADGMPVLHRSNSKSTARRLSTASRYTRQSVINPNKLQIPSTYGTSDLYGGPPSPVPPTPATPRAGATSSTSAGRARVKAPYAPASLLRTSTNPPSRPDPSNHFDGTPYVLPPLSPVVKSDDHRERDTKALASALGLASPVPGSPQTIYPDDSVTLAGDRRRSRSQYMSPTLDDSARLGKLMLSNLQSTVSIPDASNTPQAGGSSSRARAVPRKRVEEKPPRVPSPPPLPSLAQMALAHNNPQDFEDYKSPTYSIYGLYEADRKSRNTDGGGYR
ncbi:hypothetical protein BDY19DRAFT_989272 [Irpex rosettiformis]|uniref:Uncharacterized protein n=1 Tax=Irpex rosettiformis TaxID=378272 RepID=A0ACB8UHE3_9APHY|nr:hypothetical protein BDY19DRAFT_989272 [Irpex rosettiformis]